MKNRAQKHSGTVSVFRSLFCTVLASFGSHFGGQNPPKMPLKSVTKNGLDFYNFLEQFGLQKWYKNHPGPQGPPRELPRVPKEPPRVPKVSKRAPPGTLRGSILDPFGSILDPWGSFLAPLSAILTDLFAVLLVVFEVQNAHKKLPKISKNLPKSVL